jgi:hypothetical protein
VADRTGADEPRLVEQPDVLLATDREPAFVGVHPSRLPGLGDRIEQLTHVVPAAHRRQTRGQPEGGVALRREDLQVPRAPLFDVRVVAEHAVGDDIVVSHGQQPGHVESS